MKTTLAFAVLIALTVTLTSAILIQPATMPTQLHNFRGLGDLPGGIVDSVADSVSANGTVVVGTSNSAAGQQAFRWTRDGGMVALGLSHAYAVSADGTTTVGFARNSEPARWMRGDVQKLGKLIGHDYGTASGVSADGSVIVGRCEPRSSEDCMSFVWTQCAGMARLGPVPDRIVRVVAHAVSADGRVVVGAMRHESDSDEAFRWTDESGFVGLGMLPGHTDSIAYGVSADGSVVVGASESGGTDAFRWTRQTGMVRLNPSSVAPCDSCAFGVSADGSVIVGQWSVESKQEAFIWDATHGVRSIPKLVASQSDSGATLNGWKLIVAKSVSQDGKAVVGSGLNRRGDREGWIAYLGNQPDTAR